MFYHECWEGEIRSRRGCGSPLIFNVKRNFCDFPDVGCFGDAVVCPDDVAGNSPTPATSESSPTATASTTQQVTTSRPPQVAPMATTPTTGIVVTTKPTPMPVQTIEQSNWYAISHVASKRDLIEKYVLMSYTNEVPYPSKSYTYDHFMLSLQKMGVDGFGADFKFNLWEGKEDEYHYGLVNLAAFLANAMVESIEHDACDELNWEQVSGRYAISNSCGQEGRSYQDETCDDEDIYSCEVKPEMETMAISSATEDRTPPPLECRPGSGPDNNAGYYDEVSATLIANAPYSNDAGRKDIEGMLLFQKC